MVAIIRVCKFKSYHIIYGIVAVLQTISYFRARYALATNVHPSGSDINCEQHPLDSDALPPDKGLLFYGLKYNPFHSSEKLREDCVAMG